MDPKRKVRRARSRVTDATAAARAALTQADILGVAATQGRISGATRGVFGAPVLRSSGDISSYFLQPQAPALPGTGRRKGKGPAKPKGPAKRPRRR